MIQNNDSLSEFDPTKGAGEPETQRKSRENLCPLFNHEDTKKECFYKETRKIGDFLFLDSWSLYIFFSSFRACASWVLRTRGNHFYYFLGASLI